ncbi:hypothetical protein PV327_007469 [Microctonus hyperodae]|uniref:Peptidase M10 metallopeptidase domain-containing protein n=1 Tax=Microctonus hyperodae TaxID=165561 RepID=A0AA39FZX8_MICHY|nr:hypothetical protein PV327_007469 [Microctonus hyperodae]
MKDNENKYPNGDETECAMMSYGDEKLLQGSEDDDVEIEKENSGIGTTEGSISTCGLRGDAPTGLDKNRVRQELSRALDLWARNSKLTFQEVNSEHADILISFQRFTKSKYQSGYYSHNSFILILNS